MQSAGVPPQRHIVVFDCNVYLDVAALVGPPFSWDEFDEVVARLTKNSSPTVMVDRAPRNGRVYPDSIRALALCTSGNFAGLETMHVGVNDSIQTLVFRKAMQDLGWSRADAATLLSEMIGGLVDWSDGFTIIDNYPDSNPPLDHEDGMVFGACRKLASDDPLSRVYCVTRDIDFLDYHRMGQLQNHTIVLPPPQFVSLVRAARNPASRMAPRR
ncbi:hypothetical protein ATM97_27820 [Nocardia sp. MH4]|uniref:hypothetical protein n=1 Tax=Nocardia sp. MH4 TaxID=1768677 RepID=UPI001C4F1101|nr:hypothetical protein [Nocardia sp. MH4]MBW0275013.1 hypothetical protein [Nocardia sp. MH4]